MRIAVAQTPGTRLEQWRDTLALIERLIECAADEHAALLVLPECVWPAYCLGSCEVYLAARSGGLPGPAAFLTRLQGVARRRRIAVCAGFVAEEGARLFNAACVVEADGRVAGITYKRFLWAFDREYFARGTSVVPLDADFARVGVMVCADARLPEIPATLAARGAELLLQPTGWVNAGRADRPWNPQPDFLIRARAAEFGVPVASASKWGREGVTDFVGGSLICDAAGAILAQCGSAETTVATADVEPAPARQARVSAAERAILRRSQPAVVRRDVGLLEVVPLAGDVSPEHATAVLAERERRGGAVLAVGTGATAITEIEQSYAHVRFLNKPVAEPIEHCGVRIGTLTVDDAARFAPARCLALRGCHVLVVFGADTPTVLLRARACENQVFVVGAGRGGWCAIDPRGQVLACHEHCDALAPTHIALAVSTAADKCVAPHTDVLADRHPEEYEF